MNKLLSLLLALAMIISLTACGVPAQEDETISAAPAPTDAASPAVRVEEEISTVVPGKLTVAFSPDFAPMEFVDLTKEGQDRFVGFDVALAKFIAENLRLQLVLVPLSFEACQNAVADGLADMSISGYSWSARRELMYNLSDFYQAGNNEDAQVLITLASNADRFASAENLAGIRIGAQKSSLQKQLTAEQLPDSVLVQFENLDEAVEQLKNGEFDCIAVADGNADAIIAANPDIIKSGFQFDVADQQKGYTILLQKGNDELTQLVNNILSKAEMYYETWYADARATAGIGISYDDEGNIIED